MDKDNFELQLKENINFIEEVLKKFLPEVKGEQKTIFDAMEYSCMAGGKRIRPMLVLEAYKGFLSTKNIIVKNDGTDDVEAFLAAIEFIHTSSLVHDDLPVMDNDEYRRGRKTTHVVYGAGMATLAGDALLNYAYEVASDAAFKAALKGSKKEANAVRILAQKTGVFGMIGGQVVDVELTGKKPTFEQIEFINRLKTGALLEACLMMGACLAGANDEEIKTMEKVGHLIGMAFQIQDDILDITSTTEELGKPVHSDEKNEKVTYVTYEGIENSSKKVVEYSNEAKEILKNMNFKNEFLFELIDTLSTRRK